MRISYRCPACKTLDPKIKEYNNELHYASYCHEVVGKKFIFFNKHCNQELFWEEYITFSSPFDFRIKELAP